MRQFVEAGDLKITWRRGAEGSPDELAQANQGPHPTWALGRLPWRACLRALRPHQWAKNLLLLLPALSAHLAWTPPHLLQAFLGLLCFSLTASAVYVANDLFDAPHDRRHPTKRFRPFAAGQLSLLTGLVMELLLLAAAAAVAVWLPPGFQLVLVVYFGTSMAYSLFIKRKPILDVLTLASLYAARVLAGSALMAVELSSRFLAFSGFCFLSLALMKRVTELKRNGNNPGEMIPGRGYMPADLSLLVHLGVAASMISALVYCQYITSTDVMVQYSKPNLLWLGLPLLLYWQGRIWLVAHRGNMTDDPVVFALQDRVSQITVAAFLTVVFLAS